VALYGVFLSSKVSRSVTTREIQAFIEKKPKKTWRYFCWLLDEVLFHSFPLYDIRKASYPFCCLPKNSVSENMKEFGNTEKRN
jgi:hypothetical protein